MPLSLSRSLSCFWASQCNMRNSKKTWSTVPKHASEDTPSKRLQLGESFNDKEKRTDTLKSAKRSKTDRCFQERRNLGMGVHQRTDSASMSTVVNWAKDYLTKVPRWYWGALISKPVYILLFRVEMNELHEVVANFSRKQVSKKKLKKKKKKKKKKKRKVVCTIKCFLNSVTTIIYWQFSFDTFCVFVCTMFILLFVLLSTIIHFFPACHCHWLQAVSVSHVSSASPSLLRRRSLTRRGCHLHRTESYKLFDFL